MVMGVGKFVGIERFVGVVSVSDPRGNGNWGDVHLSGRLIGVTLGVLIGEEMWSHTPVLL
jgi:hypothetical protein